MKKGKYQTKGAGIRWPVVLLLLVVLAVFVVGTVLLIHACLYISNTPDPTPETSVLEPQNSEPATQPPTDPPIEPTAPPETEPETDPETETEPEETEPEETEPEETEPEETEPETAPEYDDTVSKDVVAVTKSVLGKPYAFGGSGPEEFDTTGLIYYCFRQCEIAAPRLLEEQFGYGEAVAQEFLQPGDVVFFYLENPGEAEYVGIYIGNNTFVAVSSSRNAVAEQNMGIDYFAERFLGARRYS